MPERFLIVTPSFNTAEFLDCTILSVVTQEGPFEIDYHVQDAGSTDGSVAILEKWQRRLDSGDFPTLCRGVRFSYSVERDRGMYDGIANGFDTLLARDPSPAWMSYINASDLLLPNALRTVAAIGGEFPQFSWLTGRLLLIGETGAQITVSWLASFPRRAIRDGLHRGGYLDFVSQQGTCWTTELWARAGGNFRRDLRVAGDFDLWVRLAQHTELALVDSTLGAFRYHSNQLSHDQTLYFDEAALALGPDGCERQRASWAEWKTALNAGDVGSMVEAGFAGPVILFDWTARRHRLTHRLPVPYARIPAIEPQRRV